MQTPERLLTGAGGRYPAEQIAAAPLREPVRPGLIALDAEREVLGAAMADEQACAYVAAEMRAEFFEGRHHRQLFEAIERLFAEGQPVNPMTVLDTDPSIGSGVVTDIYAGLSSTSNAEFYGVVVKQKWIERQTLSLLRGASSEVGQSDIFDLIDSLTYRLSGLSSGTSSQTHIKYAVEEAIARLHEWKAGRVTDRLPTGIFSLDAATEGYPVGELTTFAAQTGAGKTSFLVQSAVGIARREARTEKPRTVLVFSCEMGREQLAARAGSNASEVNLRHLRDGSSSDADADRYENILIELAQLSIHIDDAPNPTLTQIAARCQYVASQGNGLAAVFVDYDEKIHTEGQSEELRVSAIAQGLKAIAKRFGVPVVALSQYGRQQNMHSRPPEDSFLRYSGKKEQESALILHWIWPKYWLNRGKAPESIYGYDKLGDARGWVRATKNRNGPTGQAELVFDERYTRFIDPKDPETPLHVRAAIRHRNADQAPF